MNQIPLRKWVKEWIFKVLIGENMLKIIVHAYIDNAEKAIVEVVFASSDKSRISEKMAELTNNYPNDYLAVYDLPLDTDLTTLPHYPSVELVRKILINCVSYFIDITKKGKELGS